MKWKTIDTAPKDGQPIIGSNGKWVETMRWSTNGLAWTSEYTRGALAPTHWVPLPKPSQNPTLG